MSYSAIVTTIAVKPHPNADKIQLGVVASGNQVVVGLDTKDGDIGIFFNSDGQLSHAFCVANHLYNRTAAVDLVELGAHWPSYGFFDHKRRVRAQTFRGEKSDGFWIPLNSLDKLSPILSAGLKVGDTFSEINGIEICNRYETKATKAARLQQPKLRRETPNFPKHGDTMQFRFLEPDAVPIDSVIYITEKLHGTSGRVGRVWDVAPLKWWEKLLRREPRSAWQILNGSKNVVLEKTAGEGYYGTNEFRHKAVEEILPQLHKGEVIYYELVGYVNGDSKIMPDHDNEKLKDKTILKQYGPRMSYTYGCPVGECRLFVYKILNVNQDGVIFELSWHGVLARCAELGLNPVPTLLGPLTMPLLTRMWDATDSFRALAAVIDVYTEGASTLSPAHIREGVVVRIESTKGVKNVKNKSFTFKVLEGIMKEDETVVDMEEAS